MWRSRKARDLSATRARPAQRVGRPPEWKGDAKLAGAARRSPTRRVRELNGEAAASGPRHLFRLDLREVSTVGLNDERTALVIEVWTPGGGVRTMSR